MTSNMNLVKLSKTMSWILRHRATDKGLEMNPDGYVLLEDMLKLNEFKYYNFDNIKNVVDTNEKQRFTMKKENEKWYIRANQGHSHKVASVIDENQLLTKLIEPLPLVVHGTTYKAYKEIQKSGLKKMGRSHIHFAINDDFIEGNKEQSGIRKNSEILIYLNMKKALDDGIEFFLSDNKVVLSKGLGEQGLLDKKYFEKVYDKFYNKFI